MTSVSAFASIASIEASLLYDAINTHKESIQTMFCFFCSGRNRCCYVIRRAKRNTIVARSTEPHVTAYAHLVPHPFFKQCIHRWLLHVPISLI